MNPKFHCPHCYATLRVRENIIFKVRTPDLKMGILLLNPELGNYSYISSPELKFENGEKVDFLCPVCCINMEAKGINPNLVHILMRDEESREYDVFFSSIAGEHSTFMIEKENVVGKFGEDASSYLNYFMSRLKINLEKAT